MHCTNCGALLPNGAKTCPNCGAATPLYSSNPGSSLPDATIPASNPGSSTPDATIPASSWSGPMPSTAYGGNPYGSPISTAGQSGPYTPPPSTAASFDPYGAPPPLPPTPVPMNQQAGGPAYYPAPPAPISPLQQAQKPRRRFSVGLILLLVLLAILLIGGGGALFYYAAVYQPHLQQVQATATAQTHATSTANAQATAAVENRYTHSGTLVFTDPLSANNQGHDWDTNSNCAFTGGTYHAIAPDPHYSDYCIAKATDYTNFAYEVQMKVLKGDGGGILFHVENTNPNEYYEFDVAQDGSYGLYKADAGKYPTLTTGTSPVVHQGLNQTNVLAVVVQGNKITLYVNGKLVDTVTDSTFTHGQIGVSASVYNQVTEASFTNARLWKL
jgi:Domain of Unknown Function (DUF1080)/zinc-ribbon domain